MLGDQVRFTSDMWIAHSAQVFSTVLLCRDGIQAAPGAVPHAAPQLEEADASRVFDVKHIWSRPPAGYPPPWYGPPWPWPRDTRSQHEAVQDYFPSIFLFYPHLVESPANTIGFSTCKDYDPHQSQSHPPTTTPPTPQGGRGGTMTITWYIQAGIHPACAGRHEWAIHLRCAFGTDSLRWRLFVSFPRPLAPKEVAIASSVMKNPRSYYRIMECHTPWHIHRWTWHAGLLWQLFATRSSQGLWTRRGRWHCRRPLGVSYSSIYRIVISFLFTLQPLFELEHVLNCFRNVSWRWHYTSFASIYSVSKDLMAAFNLPDFQRKLHELGRACGQDGADFRRKRLALVRTELWEGF